MADGDPSEATPAVRVGLVDPRPVVRDQLRAAVAGLAGFSVVAVHAEWSTVPAPVDGTVVWVAAAPAPGAAVRWVSLEDVAVDDAAGLAAQLRSAGVLDAPPEADGPAFRPLSAREDRVLAGIARGRTAAEIAGELGISPKGVANARRRAMAKLSVGTQVEAVSRAHALQAAGVDLTGGRWPR